MKAIRCQRHVSWLPVVGWGVGWMNMHRDHGKRLGAWVILVVLVLTPASASLLLSPGPNPSPRSHPELPPGPSRQITCPPTSIDIMPGDSIQSAIDAARKGAVFCLARGEHLLRSRIWPKSRQVFIGEFGAVLSGRRGAKYLTAFSTSYGVTFKNLVVEDFNSEPFIGAIDFRRGDGWKLVHNEIRRNASIGFLHGSDAKVLNNYVHHNADFGGGGEVRTEAVPGNERTYASGALVEGNKIAYNNTGRTELNVSAGGLKWCYTTHLTVRGNYVHDNNGPGLWTDCDNVRTVVEDNIVEDNASAGIFHEVSRDAIIRGNVVRNNGIDPNDCEWGYGANILIAHSSGVEVYGNRVEGGCRGIVGIQQIREDSKGLTDLYVHDNVIGMGPGSWTGVVVDSDSLDWVFGAEANNRFENNTYTSEDAGAYWRWDDRVLSKRDWQSYGNDDEE